MKKKNVKPKEWITLVEVMSITRHDSRKGVMSFARKHGIIANKSTGRLLFVKDDIYAALNDGAIRLGR